MSITQQEVLGSNRRFHNAISERHDMATSYIAKKNCKRFYEELFLNIADKEHILLKGARVLELGCATGNFLDFFLRRHIGSYHGVDISEKMIERAQEKAAAFDTKTAIQFSTASAENILQKAIEKQEKFDVILSVSFLHHLFHLENFLHIVEQVVAPGGVYIALHEPNHSTKKRFSIIMLDGLLAYIVGYYTRDSNFFSRMQKMIKALIKRLRGLMNNLSAPQTSIPAFDQIDYQLNFSGFDAKKLANIKVGQDTHAYTDSYGYFVFDVLSRFAKQPVNYFYFVLKKKR